MRVGTRSSALAMSQAVEVADLLVAAGLRGGFEIVEIGHEGGDPSYFAGGQVMTGALREALLKGDCDVAVHMLKDLPTTVVAGLTFGAYIKRVDPREALCGHDGWTLATLPEGAKVGLSSALRRAQLLEVRPDLQIIGVRGPVDSRLQRVAAGDLAATILAYPVLIRQDATDSVTELLAPAVMMPTPSQGILVVEVRTDADQPIRRALRRIDHFPTRLQAVAERSLQERIEEVTRAPLGALARLVDGHSSGNRSRLELSAVVSGPEQASDLRRSRSVTLDDVDTDADAEGAVRQARQLGRALAEELLEAGAGGLPEHRLERPHRAPKPRVLVPRFTDAINAVFGEAIVKAGGEPVFVTLTRTIPASDDYLDHVLDRLSTADRVGMTSAESVALLEQRAKARGTSLADILRDTPVAAFGASVGSALVGASVTVDMLPSLDSSVGNLLSVWPPAAEEDGHRPLALLPGSSNASPLLATGLREIGWDAEELPVYTRVTADPSPEHEAAIEEGWPEAVVIASRSGAKAIEELFGLPPEHVRIVAVGRIPARDAKELGLKVSAVSTSPKPSAIAAAALDGLVPKHATEPPRVGG